MKSFFPTLITAILVLSLSCTGGSKKSTNMKKSEKSVKIITLAPGHFHAGLVQKSMYPKVSDVVHVYAPEGPEVQSYLDMIKSFNTRSENPTQWKEKTYIGSDYFKKMLDEKAGNVVVIAGNNARKTEYINESVKTGLNVLADKPMVVTPENFPLLEEAFKTAEKKGILLYDIMTERHEITTILQRELSQIAEVFGTLMQGTPDNPAMVQASVHRFSKIVADKPLIRPAWFFDVSQEGEGILDVTVHLIDLIQWEAFPGKIIKRDDVKVTGAKRWTTDLTLEQFSKVTGLKSFPGYMEKYIDNDLLKVYSNGEIVYKINGIWAKVSVIWNFDEPKGGDTHYSIMRGTKCNLVIRQGEEQQFKTVLYVEPTGSTNLTAFEQTLTKTVETTISGKYPGVELTKLSDKQYAISIPQKYKIGHEAHFRQVTEKYLKYLKEGKLPSWEVPNMITKYYITTTALKLAMEGE